MILEPLAPTRLFVVPLGFPPPVQIGDALTGGWVVCQLCDRFKLGNRSVWRFYVQREKHSA